MENMNAENRDYNTIMKKYKVGECVAMDVINRFLHQLSSQTDFVFKEFDINRDRFASQIINAVIEAFLQHFDLEEKKIEKLVADITDSWVGSPSYDDFSKFDLQHDPKVIIYTIHSLVDTALEHLDDKLFEKAELCPDRGEQSHFGEVDPMFCRYPGSEGNPNDVFNRNSF